MFDSSLTTYYELSDHLQAQARELFPDDFVDRFYKTAGAYIEYSAK